MKADLLGRKMLDRNGILYPMLVIAALSVIIFSVLGVAIMTGLLPRAKSMNDSYTITSPKTGAAGTAQESCGNCGVVEAVNAVAVDSAKDANKTVHYQVRIRMGDGISRTIQLYSAPAFSVGDKVKVVNGELVSG